MSQQVDTKSTAEGEQNGVALLKNWMEKNGFNLTTDTLNKLNQNGFKTMLMFYNLFEVKQSNNKIITKKVINLN